MTELKEGGGGQDNAKGREKRTVGQVVPKILFGLLSMS